MANSYKAFDFLTNQSVKIYVLNQFGQEIESCFFRQHAASICVFVYYVYVSKIEEFVGKNQETSSAGSNTLGDTS